MLLGFIVSQWGIEPNPEKVSAITRMGPIRDLKGVQRVMGCPRVMGPIRDLKACPCIDS